MLVLYVKTRHEKHVAVLRSKRYEELVPAYNRRIKSRISDLPAFTGYVFCRFDPDKRLPLLTIPSVFSIVSFGNGPSPVEEKEIDALKRTVQNKLSGEPWSTLPSGTKVTVSSGPMQGVEGVVVITKNVTRVIISMSPLHQSIAVELDRKWLQAVKVAA